MHNELFSESSRSRRAVTDVIDMADAVGSFLSHRRVAPLLMLFVKRPDMWAAAHSCRGGDGRLLPTEVLEALAYVMDNNLSAMPLAVVSRLLQTPLVTDVLCMPAQSVALVHSLVAIHDTGFDDDDSTSMGNLALKDLAAMTAVTTDFLCTTKVR